MTDIRPSHGTLAFYRERQSIEWPITLSVLDALPDGQLGYRPHPISPTAEMIGLTLVRCLDAAVQLTQEAQAQMHFRDHITKGDLTTEYGRLSQELEVHLAGKDEGFWQEPTCVLANGETVLSMPRGQILWLFHFDAIHHRGQLTTYLRPMGGHVPNTYGSSADGNTH